MYFAGQKLVVNTLVFERLLYQLKFIIHNNQNGPTLKAVKFIERTSYSYSVRLYIYIPTL